MLNANLCVLKVRFASFCFNNRFGPKCYWTKCFHFKIPFLLSLERKNRSHIPYLPKLRNKRFSISLASISFHLLLEKWSILHFSVRILQLTAHRRPHLNFALMFCPRCFLLFSPRPWLMRIFIVPWISARLQSFYWYSNHYSPFVCHSVCPAACCRNCQSFHRFTLKKCSFFPNFTFLQCLG